MSNKKFSTPNPLGQYKLNQWWPWSIQDNLNPALLKLREADIRFIPLNPININGHSIDFSDQAEHVGIIRSCNGNMPNLVNRFTSHRKALAASLPCGTARSHRANLAACLSVEKLYALPVLMSGLASLVLSNTEINHLDQHYLNTLRRSWNSMRVLHTHLYTSCLGAYQEEHIYI